MRTPQTVGLVKSPELPTNYQPETSVPEAGYFVKPPELPANYQVLAAMRYPHQRGVDAVAALAQGERDILEEVRERLQWPSILSLTYKWYPLYPYRQCWKRALEKCSGQKLRTRTLNLKYLLLAVITQVRYSLAAKFSGRTSLNRLLHPNNNSRGERSNRLLHHQSLLNPKPGGYQELVLIRQGLM